MPAPTPLSWSAPIATTFNAASVRGPAVEAGDMGWLFSGRDGQGDQGLQAIVDAVATQQRGAPQPLLTTGHRAVDAHERMGGEGEAAAEDRNGLAPGQMAASEEERQRRARFLQWLYGEQPAPMMGNGLMPGMAQAPSGGPRP